MLPPSLQASPPPGMSFVYSIPCLLPSEERGPLHLSPISPCHLGVETMNTLVHLILNQKQKTKKTLLLHLHPEAPGNRLYVLVRTR